VDWRDEFDEDRVGAENFEALNMDQQGNLRSGTRRNATVVGEEEPGFVEFAVWAGMLED
jgi:hypothetical protein